MAGLCLWILKGSVKTDFKSCHGITAANLQYVDTSGQCSALDLHISPAGVDVANDTARKVHQLSRLDLDTRLTTNCHHFTGRIREDHEILAKEIIGDPNIVGLEYDVHAWSKVAYDRVHIQARIYRIIWEANRIGTYSFSS